MASYLGAAVPWLLVSWPSFAGSGRSVFFGGRNRVFKTDVLFKPGGLKRFATASLGWSSSLGYKFYKCFEGYGYTEL